MKIPEIIPLNADILLQAASAEENYKLKDPQDAFVYVSMLKHLQENKPQEAYFLNRNWKDFKTPDIVDELQSLNFKIFDKFDGGYKFLQSKLLS